MASHWQNRGQYGGDYGEETGRRSSWRGEEGRERWGDDERRFGSGRGRGYRSFEDDYYGSGGYGGYSDRGYASGMYPGYDRPWSAGYGEDRYGFGPHGGYEGYQSRGGSSDWGSSGYGGRYGSGFGSRGNPEYRYGAYGHERGFMARAGDEVASWFGDEEAARRREMDARHRGRGPKNYTRSDERIREDVNDRLSDDPHIDASGIEVTVSDGEVTLDGTVYERFAKRHAEDIAENVSGVKHVQNNLRVSESTEFETAGAAGMAAGTVAGNGGASKRSSASRH